MDNIFLLLPIILCVPASLAANVTSDVPCSERLQGSPFFVGVGQKLSALIECNHNGQVNTTLSGSTQDIRTYQTEYQCFNLSNISGSTQLQMNFIGIQWTFWSSSLVLDSMSIENWTSESYCVFSGCYEDIYSDFYEMEGTRCIKAKPLMSSLFIVEQLATSSMQPGSSTKMPSPTVLAQPSPTVLAQPSPTVLMQPGNNTTHILTGSLVASGVIVVLVLIIVGVRSRYGRAKPQKIHWMNNQQKLNVDSECPINPDSDKSGMKPAASEVTIVDYLYAPQEPCPMISYAESPYHYVSSPNRIEFEEIPHSTINCDSDAENPIFHVNTSSTRESLNSSSREEMSSLNQDSVDTVPQQSAHCEDRFDHKAGCIRGERVEHRLCEHEDEYVCSSGNTTVNLFPTTTADSDMNSNETKGSSQPSSIIISSSLTHGRSCHPAECSTNPHHHVSRANQHSPPLMQGSITDENGYVYDGASTGNSGYMDV